MMSTFKKLIMVSRPVSWVNTAYPFAVAYWLAGGTDITLLVVATLFFLIPYNLLMYGVNDIFDYESDIRNPRKGGIEGMREQRELHPTIAKAVVLTNVPFVAYLLYYGTLVSNLVLAAVLFFVVAYSIAKLRFKERPFIDSITSSLHFVGPAVFALSLAGFPAEAIPYIIAFFLWGMASHAFGAVQDILPDREGKIASIATVLGARRTVYFAGLLYVIAAIVLFLQPLPFALVCIICLAYVANILPLHAITDKTSGRANRPWRRFIWLNLAAGFLITMLLLMTHTEALDLFIG
jgi:4-hydroxybenzoate polyprenyltransferase